MKEESAFSELTSDPQKGTARFQFFMPFLVIAALIIVLLAGLYVLGATTKKSAEKKSPVPTKAVATQTPAPTLTPAATPKLLARKDLQGAVLNGSGTAGAAGKVSSHFRSLGDTGSKVGNADQFTYQDITITIDPEQKAYSEQLKTDVQEGAPNSTVTIEEGVPVGVDAQVVVGR